MALLHPTSPLLLLPGEIRNQIWGYLLVIPPPSTSQTLGEKTPVYPHVLRVCKQIQSEAQPILYRKNTFIAHPTLLVRLPQLRRWLDPVPTPHLQAMIRRHHIFVRLECDARFTTKAATEAFSGADELTVEVFRSQFRGSSNQVLRLFEGVRGVRKARIFGCVGDWPEYVRLLELSMMSPEGTDILEEERRKAGRMQELGEGVEGVWTEGESLVASQA